MSSRHPLTPRRGPGRGLSIVEMMVSIVVALLVSLAAVNTAITFLASQRQGIAATGSSVNSAAVMAALKDDLAVAGLGFFGDSTYLCNTLNFSLNANLLSDGAVFSPLQVTRTAAGDTIDVVFGSRVESGANVRLRAASDGTSSALESFLPVAVNEAVLLAPAQPANVRPCLVRTVTAITPSTPNSAQILSFGNAGRHNAAVFANNPPFDDQGRVTQLGVLNWNRYRLDNGNLLLERPLDGTTAVIARNVISFRLQYGISAAAPGSTTLQEWAHPTDNAAGNFAAVDATTLPRIRALRVGLIVRSPQQEKRNAAGQCVATEERPTLWGLPAENLDDADWACWRYRTSTVVVPLRNLVLGQQL
jgi:type IV pilus assembly protein PilW